MALLLTPSLLSRAFPLVASGAVHVGLATAMIVSYAGHARAGTVGVESTEVEVVTIAEPAAAPVIEETPPAAPKVLANAPAPTHTHPYAVPDHDARPHDPSIVHDHEAPVVAPPSEPAQASAAVTSDAPAALPRFTIASGTAPSQASGHVASSADGNGGPLTAPGPVAQETIYTPASVSVSAKLSYRAPAAYPSLARASEIEGKVTIEIVVDTSGRVVDARVSRRAGSGFDESALTAVRSYRFSPAEREGRAVRVRMPITVDFQLR